VILVRRSHGRKQEIMNTTKTKAHQRLALPADLMAILRRHVENLPPGKQEDSDLLFPSCLGASSHLRRWTSHSEMWWTPSS